MSNTPTHINNNEQQLINKLSQLIKRSKKQVAVQANSTLTLLFWQVGTRINKFILQHKRAVYGKQIVATLSKQLVTQFGKIFEERNLRRMFQFAEQFADFTIVSTLSTQLSWSHFLELLPLKNKEAKLFYANKIIEETWSVRELCTETSKEQIELLEMHKDSIMVAEYWTELPSKNLLKEKIRQAVSEAKERLERRKLL